MDKLEEVSYLIKNNSDTLRLSDYLVLEEKKNYDNLAVELTDYI